jgi:hypothetical protein
MDNHGNADVMVIDRSYFPFVKYRFYYCPWKRLQLWLFGDRFTTIDESWVTHGYHYKGNTYITKHYSLHDDC